MHLLGVRFLRMIFNVMCRALRKILDPSPFIGIDLIRIMCVMRIMLKYTSYVYYYHSNISKCVFLIFLNQPSWSAEDGKHLPTYLFLICLVYPSLLLRIFSYYRNHTNCKIVPHSVLYSLLLMHNLYRRYK